MNLSNITQSKYFKNGVVLIGIILIALASFVLGVTVGVHKAKFSYAWGQNYERNFVGGRYSMMGDRNGYGRGDDMPGERMMERFGIEREDMMKDFRNGHGVSGDVISSSEDSLVIKDRFERENVVTVNEKTVIMKKGERMKINDIAQNDRVVVIGYPSEDGKITADFIRIFPSEI